MRKAGRLAAQALDLLCEEVRPGVQTQTLDDKLLTFALENDALPAPLFYRGFTRASCTSVNHVICHGIPGNQKLREGDIINIDVTLIVDGWHGDVSRTVPVGRVKPHAQRLMDVAERSLDLAISTVRHGAYLGDVGHAIQSYVEGERCSVVRDFTGHGLGRAFHQPPTVLHFGKPGTGIKLQEGMLFTIEPMVNLGGYKAKIKPDGWTAVTKDRSLSAQFEHSIGVTRDGCVVFTRNDDP